MQSALNKKVCIEISCRQGEHGNEANNLNFNMQSTIISCDISSVIPMIADISSSMYTVCITYSL